MSATTLRLTTATLLVLLAGAVPVAQGRGVAWQTASVPGTAGASEPSLALAGGEPGIAFSADGVVHFARRSGGAWSVQAVAPGRAPVLATAPGGTPRIAFLDPGGAVRLALPSGGGWSTEVVDAGPVVRLDLAVDSGGRAHLAYARDPEEIRYARRTGTRSYVRESIATSDPPSRGHATVKLALDPGGRPSVLFDMALDGFEGQDDLYLAARRTGWQLTMVLASDDYTYDYAAAGLGIDASGHRHIAAAEFGHPNRDTFLRRLLVDVVPQPWPIPFALPALDGGERFEGNTEAETYCCGPTGLALDRAGRPAVSWAFARRGATPEVRYAASDGAGWWFDAVGPGGQPSLARASDGTPSIALVRDGALHLAVGVPGCDGRAATIVGTAAGDALTGTPGDDVIAGRSGDDRIDGRGGRDVLCGDDGRDVLGGGDGDDTLAGGSGDDTLAGGLGADSGHGGPGSDLVRGGGGEDVLASRDPRQRLVAAGGDRLLGDAGHDRLEGDEDADTISGGPGDDVARARGGNDAVQGDDGHDDLDGGEPTPLDAIEPPNSGEDRVFGGRGDDVIAGGGVCELPWSSGDPLEEATDRLSGGPGADLVRGGNGPDLIQGDDGNDRLIGLGGADLLLGLAGADVVHGDSMPACDLSWASPGDDELRGGDGPDRLFGDEGVDLLLGGRGRDACDGETVRECEA